MTENLEQKIFKNISLKPKDIAEFASLGRVYSRAKRQINKLFEFYTKKENTEVKKIVNIIKSDISSLFGYYSFSGIREEGFPEIEQSLPTVLENYLTLLNSFEPEQALTLAKKGEQEPPLKLPDFAGDIVKYIFGLIEKPNEHLHFIKETMLKTIIYAQEKGTFLNKLTFNFDPKAKWEELKLIGDTLIPKDKLNEIEMGNLFSRMINYSKTLNDATRPRYFKLVTMNFKPNEAILLAEELSEKDYKKFINFVEKEELQPLTAYKMVKNPDQIKAYSQAKKQFGEQREKHLLRDIASKIVPPPYSNKSH